MLFEQNTPIVETFRTKDTTCIKVLKQNKLVFIFKNKETVCIKRIEEYKHCLNKSNNVCGF